LFEALQRTFCFEGLSTGISVKNRQHPSFSAYLADGRIFPCNDTHNIIYGKPFKPGKILFIAYQRATNIHQWQTGRRQYPKIPDLVESVWKDMLKKPTDELHNIQSNGAVVFACFGIFAPEGHFPVFQFRDTVVADGNPMRVPGKIFQHMIGCLVSLCQLVTDDYYDIC
jgi:hypothetical protein